MRYPADCPVFEVVTDQLNEIPQGSHLELFPDFDIATGEFDFFCWEYKAANGFLIGSNEVRPLTRAARQMLALVRR